MSTECMNIFTKITLPDNWIVDHILLRLPIKALIRFKSVSKFWFSSISSPEFAKSWLSFSSPSQKLLFIANIPTTKFFLLSYDEFENLKDPVLIDKNSNYPLNGKCVELVGCSNGLVCVNERHRSKIACDKNASREYSIFYICNPATRQYHKIINPIPKSQGVAYINNFWFGYVPCIDDYKIVMAFHSGHCKGEFYVFSLNSGEWKRMKDLDGFYNSGLPGSHYFLHISTKVFDNILFWSLRVIESGQAMPPIFGFDLVNEKLREFPSLEWLRLKTDYGYDTVNFLEINGCLAICCDPRHSGSEIWTLKRYDNWSSWERLCYFHDRMHLSHITSSGKYVVWKFIYNTCFEREFRIIDPSKVEDNEIQSQGSRFVDYDLAMALSDAVDYVEGLTSPF